MSEPHAELTIPTGTQVVTRADLRDAAGQVVRPRGAVGVIVESPADASHGYRVRFADGGEAVLRHAELSIRKAYQRHGLDHDAVLDERDLERYIIYRCVVGSRAYGLDDLLIRVRLNGVHAANIE